jgi:hypothetical protein
MKVEPVWLLTNEKLASVLFVGFVGLLVMVVFSPLTNS